jgi:hypothetical protein
MTSRFRSASLPALPLSFDYADFPEGYFICTFDTRRDPSQTTGNLETGVASMTEEAQKLITLPGVTMQIFTRCDNANGEDEVCIVVSEQGYYELEKHAQQRGRTIEEHLYFEMRHGLQAQGYNNRSQKPMAS